MTARTETIWLPKRLHDEIKDLAAIASPNETGGALLGYDAGNGIVVTDVTGPGPKAIHKLQAFVPDYDYQDEEIERIYRSSKRCHTYLGDWHTHPGGNAAMSSKDKRTLRTISRHNPARALAPAMGILAGGSPWRFTVWRYFPRALWRGRFLARFEEMKLVVMSQ